MYKKKANIKNIGFLCVEFKQLKTEYIYLPILAKLFRLAISARSAVVGAVAPVNDWPPVVPFDLSTILSSQLGRSL